MFKGLCFYKTCEHRSWDSKVGTVSRLQAAQSCILIPVGEKLSLKMFRPSLRLTLPPIQCVLRFVPRGKVDKA